MSAFLRCGNCFFLSGTFVSHVQEYWMVTGVRVYISL
jgi:hypothetical protein